MAGLFALTWGLGVVSLDEPHDENQRGRPERREARPDPVRQLSSMGYVDGTVDEDLERSGVVVHARGRTQPGLNFYSSRKQARAQLLDMQGNVVHEWSRPGMGSWQHVSLMPDGSVIGLVKDKRMFKVDEDSNLVWTFEDRVHHDLDIGPDGNIWVLARTKRAMPRYHTEHPTTEDFVVEVSPDGAELRRISVLAMFEASPYAVLLNDGDSLTARAVARSNPHRRSKEFDILHTNHVEVLDGSLADANPAFAKGNLLLSPRNAHTIVVANPQTEEIVWAWGSSKLMFQHHPTVTRDGTILVFNNGDERTGSQVLELDPRTGDIVWTYGPTEGFFSHQRGSNLRLDNGNTLITESDAGYVFEVARSGEVVWEFRNPHVKKKKQLRMAIWRMYRVDPATLTFEYQH
ncbi:MAG: arylsulfotransferase family protein [Nannocystaceae bacterium]|nr:arylsulfotransferase family protein [bacterium]